MGDVGGDDDSASSYGGGDRLLGKAELSGIVGFFALPPVRRLESVKRDDTTESIAEKTKAWDIQKHPIVITWIVYNRSP